MDKRCYQEWSKYIIHLQVLRILIVLALLHTVQSTTPQCYTGSNLNYYQGDINYSKSGRACQQWVTFGSLRDQQFPDETVAAARDRCRNPDNSPDGPWCYTTDPKVPKESCKIPQCVYKSTADICKVDESYGYELGDVLTIQSVDYPNLQNNIGRPGCLTKRKACPACKFYVELELVLPRCTTILSPTASSPPDGCQTFYIADGIYKSATGIAYINPARSTDPIKKVFTSVSNVIELMYSQLSNVPSPASYKAVIYVIEKMERIYEDHGRILSPMFPLPYYSAGEIYKYSIENSKSDTNALIIFDDWKIGSNGGSYVKLTYDNGNKTKTLDGSTKRPAMTISDKRFEVLLETGTSPDTENPLKYIGFSGHFEFTQLPQSTDNLVVDCGGYMSASEGYGGQIKYDLSVKQGTPTKSVDCIWMIPKPGELSSMKITALQLKSNTYTSPAELVIRSGKTSSDKELISLTSPGQVVATSDYVFLHVEAKQLISLQLSVLYYSFSRSSGGKCPERQFYCTNLQGVCLSNNLRDSFAQRCGLAAIPTTVSPGSCLGYTCVDRSGCYTDKDRCDGIEKCIDGSDERNCGEGTADGASGVNVTAAVLIPLVLILFIGIVIGLVYLEHRKQTLSRLCNDLMKKDDTEAITNTTELLERPGNRRSDLGFDNLAMSTGDLTEIPTVERQVAPSQQHVPLKQPYSHIRGGLGIENGGPPTMNGTKPKYSEASMYPEDRYRPRPLEFVEKHRDNDDVYNERRPTDPYGVYTPPGVHYPSRNNGDGGARPKSQNAPNDYSMQNSPGDYQRDYPDRAPSPYSRPPKSPYSPSKPLPSLDQDRYFDYPSTPVPTREPYGQNHPTDLGPGANPPRSTTRGQGDGYQPRSPTRGQGDGYQPRSPTRGQDGGFHPPLSMDHEPRSGYAPRSPTKGPPGEPRGDYAPRSPHSPTGNMPPLDYEPRSYHSQQPVDRHKSSQI